MRRFLTTAALVALFASAAPATAQNIAMTRDQIQFYTGDWHGERFPDGRPKVADELLRRVAKLDIEDVWGALRQAGFANQFEGDWKVIDESNRVMVGRALTAQYLPARPDVTGPLAAKAKLENRVGQPNIWPINMLQLGDIYVADGYGKIVDGTLIGDNLGNSIYAKSHNGVVFDASIRDLEGLEEIKGFQGYVRGWDPSAIQQMQMVAINGPIRIGRATVLPGDIVLAKREGVLFIPAYLAQNVIQQAEFTGMRDTFGHQMLAQKRFDPGEIDTKWSPKVKAAFEEWVRSNPGQVPMSKAELQDVMKRNNW